MRWKEDGGSRKLSETMLLLVEEGSRQKAIQKKNGGSMKDPDEILIVF